MDPIGFSMENFDAIGKWRERDSDTPIDASGSFPGGVAFNGVAGLKKELLSHPDPFVQTLAEKLLMYALGRNLQYYDEPAVREIVRQSKSRNLTFAAMVEAIAQSTQFQSR